MEECTFCTIKFEDSSPARDSFGREYCSATCLLGMKDYEKDLAVLEALNKYAASRGTTVERLGNYLQFQEFVLNW